MVRAIPCGFDFGQFRGRNSTYRSRLVRYQAVPPRLPTPRPARQTPETIARHPKWVMIGTTSHGERAPPIRLAPQINPWACPRSVAGTSVHAAGHVGKSPGLAGPKENRVTSRTT